MWETGLKTVEQEKANLNTANMSDDIIDLLGNYALSAHSIRGNSVKGLHSR